MNIQLSGGAKLVIQVTTAVGQEDPDFQIWFSFGGWLAITPEVSVLHTTHLIFRNLLGGDLRLGQSLFQGFFCDWPCGSHAESLSHERSCGRCRMPPRNSSRPQMVWVYPEHCWCILGSSNHGKKAGMIRAGTMGSRKHQQTLSKPT